MDSSGRIHLVPHLSAQQKHKLADCAHAFGKILLPVRDQPDVVSLYHDSAHRMANIQGERLSRS